MKHIGRIPVTAAFGLCGALLLVFLWNAAFAQSADTDRAARIREQIGMPDAKMASEADIVSIRNDLNKAMEAIVTRISLLEKDMIDLKSRIRVLEARNNRAGNDSSGAAPADPSP